MRQDIAAGWHTYWENPGDSGQTPALYWELPEGVEAGAPQWPVPERQEYGPLVNYGYSDQTSILYPLTVPEDWREGAPLAVTAEAEILVCADICIPVIGTVSTVVETGPETQRDREAASLFRQARAALPAVSPWDTRFSEQAELLKISLFGPSSDFSTVSDAYFFIGSWGGVDHAAVQGLSIGEDGLVISAKRGDGEVGDTVSGVITLFQQDGPSRSFVVNATRIAAAAEPAAAAPSLAILVVLAVAGGLLLNLMPCVFPVLAMKALALAKSRDKEPRARLVNGLAYSSGVLLSFLALAGVLLALKAGGAAVGWGFQLQDPLIVGILAYVAVAVGLNLSGLFEIGLGIAGLGGNWRFQSEQAESFATGVLAAVVAAPCTAPFMATAIGGAMLLPPVQALAVFAALGLGLALPYLVLTTVPGASRILPKPGAWMLRFKQLLAFPMYATAAWLVWVLGQQAGQNAAFLVTLGAIALAFLAWLHGALAGRRLPLRAAALTVPFVVSVGLLGWATTNGDAPGEQTTQASAVAAPYSKAAVEQHLGDGRAVFVNMTAAWCITCKVNERVALSGSDFEVSLAKHNIAYLQGDWTNRNPEITEFLERFDRLGVPLYVLFPADGKDPIILPQILSPGAVQSAFETLALAGS